MAKGIFVRENKEKKKEIQCHKCKKWGHVRKDCPYYNGWATANMVTHGDDSDNNSDVLVVLDR